MSTIVAAGVGLRQSSSRVAAARRPSSAAQGHASTAAAVPRPAPMRLTRRGRAVLVGLAALVAFGIGTMADQAQAGQQPVEVVTFTHIVAPGETLWGLASEIAGDGDVRDVVAQLADLNALSSTELIAGQELLLPVSD